jgi:nucleoside phosphorylase
MSQVESNGMSDAEERRRARSEEDRGWWRELFALSRRALELGRADDLQLHQGDVEDLCSAVENRVEAYTSGRTGPWIEEVLEALSPRSHEYESASFSALCGALTAHVSGIVSAVSAVRAATTVDNLRAALVRLEGAITWRSEAVGAIPLAAPSLWQEAVLNHVHTTRVEKLYRIAGREPPPKDALIWKIRGLHSGPVREQLRDLALRIEDAAKRTDVPFADAQRDAAGELRRVLERGLNSAIEKALVPFMDIPEEAPPRPAAAAARPMRIEEWHGSRAQAARVLLEFLAFGHVRGPADRPAHRPSHFSAGEIENKLDATFSRDLVAGVLGTLFRGRCLMIRDVGRLEGRLSTGEGDPEAERLARTYMEGAVIWAEITDAGVALLEALELRAPTPTAQAPSTAAKDSARVSEWVKESHNNLDRFLNAAKPNLGRKCAARFGSIYVDHEGRWVNLVACLTLVPSSTKPGIIDYVDVVPRVRGLRAVVEPARVPDLIEALRRGVVGPDVLPAGAEDEIHFVGSMDPPVYSFEKGILEWVGGAAGRIAIDTPDGLKGIYEHAGGVWKDYPTEDQWRALEEELRQVEPRPFRGFAHLSAHLGISRDFHYGLVPGIDLVSPLWASLLPSNVHADGTVEFGVRSWIGRDPKLRLTIIQGGVTTPFAANHESWSECFEDGAHRLKLRIAVDLTKGKVEVALDLDGRPIDIATVPALEGDNGERPSTREGTGGTAAAGTGTRQGRSARRNSRENLRERSPPRARTEARRQGRPGRRITAREKFPLPKYDPKKQGWHTRIPKIEEVREDDKRRKIDVVLLVAVAVEKDAVLRRLVPLENAPAILKVHVGKATYYLGRLGAQRVALTMCEPGASGRGGSILASTRAIEAWRPKAIVMVGMAFGADPAKQKIGDVLVASKVACYEPQRRGRALSIRRGPVVEPGLVLLDRFRNVDGWRFTRPDRKRCATRPGLMLSGEKLIDDPRFKAEMLEDYPEAIGGEMEAAGVYAAADSEKVEWIVVKGICDWADGRKNKRHQPLAAAAAVSLVERVLTGKQALTGLAGSSRRQAR